MAKMNEELKVKWVGALRSGEYSQIRGTMINNGGYCCLGVLCVVGGVDPDPAGNDEEGSYSFCRKQLGEDVSQFWGMNDTQLMTFPMIADWIEENM